jgi:hypothetical protein
VAVPAGTRIQDAVNANPTGTTFCLAAGTYSQQSVAPKASQKFVGARGTSGERLSILDGGNTTTYAFTGAAAGVEIRGLVIKRYDPPDDSNMLLGFNGTGWVIYDNEITESTSNGSNIYTGWVIRRNWIHHNGKAGIQSQADGVGAVVDSNEHLQRHIPRDQPRRAD